MPRITPSHRTVRARTRVLRYPDGTFAAQNTDLWSPVLAMKEAEEEKPKPVAEQPTQPTQPTQPAPTAPTAQPAQPAPPSVPEVKKPGIWERTLNNWAPVAEALPDLAKEIPDQIQKYGWKPSNWRPQTGMNVVTTEEPFTTAESLPDMYRTLVTHGVPKLLLPKGDGTSPEARQAGWKRIQGMTKEPLNMEGVFPYTYDAKDPDATFKLWKQLKQENLLSKEKGKEAFLQPPALGGLSTKILNIPTADSLTPEDHVKAITPVIQDAVKKLTPMEKFQGGGKLADELFRDGRRMVLMGRALEKEKGREDLAKSYIARGLMLTQAGHGIKEEGQKAMALARNKMAWGVGLLAAGIPIMAVLYRMFRGPRQQPIQINMPAAQQPAYVQAAYGGRQFGA